MSDVRPNYTIARCCKTCHYFEADSGSPYHGKCTLAEVVNPLVEEETKTHTAMTCDAHTWKAQKKLILKWAIRYGAHIPDEIL